MECFNTRFSLPTLMCTGYSVKHITFLFFIYTMLSVEENDYLILTSVYQQTLIFSQSPDSFKPLKQNLDMIEENTSEIDSFS